MSGALVTMEAALESDGDELANTQQAAAPRPPRITPRNSSVNEVLAQKVLETPYETLRQLADVIPRPSTPLRQGPAPVSASIRQSVRRTPAPARTPGQVGSARRSLAATPYLKSARREQEQRRTAALTPGRNRLNVLGPQKDTPQEGLRALSNLLAPATKVISSSPVAEEAPETLSGRVPTKSGDDYDDEPELRRPSLSLPIDEDDGDSGLLDAPQRTPIADEENVTARSLELSRRAPIERASRLSRGSFGSVRTSDGFALARIAESSDEEPDDSYVGAGAFDESPFIEGDPTIPRDFTGNLVAELLDNTTRRESLLSSDQGDAMENDLAEETELSFALTLPQVDTPTIRIATLTQSDTPDLRTAILQQSNRVASRIASSPRSTGQDVDMELDEAGEHDENELEDNMDDDSEQEVNDEDATMQETASTHANVAIPPLKVRRQKIIKVSRHGLQYPSLPVGVVKKLTTTYLRTSGGSRGALSKDVVAAIMQASDWFFEQISDDLSVLSGHAARKTIDETDVTTLLRRQRQTNASITPFALAQKHLPRELLQDLRMTAPQQARPQSKEKSSRRGLRAISEE